MSFYLYIVWMKKYLFGLLAISILFWWYSFAGENCDRRDFWSQEHNDCLAQQQQTQQQYQQNTKTPDQLKADCAAKWPNSNDTCTSSYSCETLFTDATNANNCNLARCKVQRGATSAYCQCKYVDKWIPLNTSIPFLWNCLKKANPSDPNDNAALNAFPTIISVASRILITVIMLVGFVMIVIGWIQWSAWNAAGGKKMITKVIIWFALLWTMWAILRLINPNFFK